MQLFSSMENRERALSSYFGHTPTQVPPGLISTARAPSSDLLTPSLWDVKLKIHVSNGRTHAALSPAGVSTTELVCSISCLSASNRDLQGYNIKGCKTWNCI